MAITAEELGRLVGCSTATVSRALNNTGAVAPETRAAIYRTLRETRYVPQRTRGRKKGADKLIEILYHRHSPSETVTLGHDGLAVGPLNPISESSLLAKPALGDAFWRGILDGAVAEIEAWHFKASLRTNINLEDPDFLADINGPDKAAVMVIGEPHPALKSLVDLCRYPLVLADLICDDTHDVVTTDNVAGISAAFDHLYALGHRRIGFAGKYSNFAYVERYNAFKLKMAEADLPVRLEWVYEGYSHIGEAEEGVRKILSLAERPTALLCASDCVALGAMRAAASLGIRVPQELSIVGFDDIEASALLTPALTTLHVPVHDIGRQAIRLLMSQVRSESEGLRSGCRVRLVPQLVIRESTVRAADAATAPGISISDPI